jgi:LacI family transcriptional regulator
VAFISGPLDHPDAAERLQGFKDEASKKGLALDDGLIVYGDYQEAGGFRAMNALLDARIQFTAVLAANDQMAYGARLALYRSGLRVPEDISLIGFDDLPHSAFTLPPLTSVRQSVYEIGVSAAKAMIDILNKQNPPSRLVAAELVVRESTRINRR